MTKGHLKRQRRALGREHGRRRTRRRRMLLWLGSGAAVLALIGGALFASGSGQNGPDAASETAPIEFSYLSGEQGSLADFEGEPVVLNFFASWCGPCWQEMPGFQRVHEQTEDEVAFLGMALQDTPDATRRIVERTGVTYPIGTDPEGKIFQRLGGRGMPTTVFFGEEHEVLRRHTGELTAGELSGMVEELYG